MSGSECIKFLGDTLAKYVKIHEKLENENNDLKATIRYLEKEIHNLNQL